MGGVVQVGPHGGLESGDFKGHACAGSVQPCVGREYAAAPVRCERGASAWCTHRRTPRSRRGKGRAGVFCQETKIPATAARQALAKEALARAPPLLFLLTIATSDNPPAARYRPLHL